MNNYLTGNRIIQQERLPVDGILYHQACQGVAASVLAREPVWASCLTGVVNLRSYLDNIGCQK
ncbi:MAG: hypothetical protein R3C11_23835 [Planctomycetaceae bacterium]